MATGGSDGVVAGRADDWQDHDEHVLPTEHLTLQNVRAATVTDSSGRASLYFSSVSLSLVALGIVGQASALGVGFSVFALVHFPTLFVLGVTTFVRLTQSSVEDMLYGREINRIRHFYPEFAPEATPDVIHSTHDDTTGDLANIGLRQTRWQRYVTTAGTIGVVNSVVGADALGTALWLAVVARGWGLHHQRGAPFSPVSAGVRWRPGTAAGAVPIPIRGRAERSRS